MSLIFPISCYYCCVWLFVDACRGVFMCTLESFLLLWCWWLLLFSCFLNMFFIIIYTYLYEYFKTSIIYYMRLFGDRREHGNTTATTFHIIIKIPPTQKKKHTARHRQQGEHTTRI